MYFYYQPTKNLIKEKELEVIKLKLEQDYYLGDLHLAIEKDDIKRRDFVINELSTIHLELIEVGEEIKELNRKLELYGY